MVAKMPAGLNGQDGPSCKWCLSGQCWTHGQIEKPAGLQGKGKGKQQGGKKGAQQMWSKGGAQKGGNAQMGNDFQQNPMMMAMMQQAYSMGFSGTGGAGPQKNSGSWKGELVNAFQKMHKTTLTKEDVQYEVSEVEGGGFVATVTVQGEEYTGEPAASKKNAENNAAEVAVTEMFPDHINNMQPQQGGGGGNNMQAMMQAMMAGGGGGGMKRKAEAQQPQGGKKLKLEDQPVKCRFIHAITLLAQRTLTKEDIVFVVEPVEGELSQYVATVTVNVTSDTFTGPARASKKDAESAATEVAMKAMGDRIAPFEAEHKAKKAAKNKEALTKLKEAHQAKKDAAKAEKEANGEEAVAPAKVAKLG